MPTKIKIRCMILSFAVATGQFLNSAAAQDLLKPIIDLHNQQKNTGLAVVVRDNGQNVAEAYLGQAVIEHNIPVTEDTRFQVMSITKAFVGAALIKSVSAGLVDLDKPIQDYISDYPNPPQGVITLRKLAAHTAGIPHLSHPDRKSLYVQHFSDARAAIEVFNELPLLHIPGKEHSYSSSGYTLIAAVLESVYKKPFSQILDELIFKPLSLENTAAGNVLRPTENLARSYSFVDVWTYQPVDTLQQVPTWDFSYNVGGGNLITTANDLARFGDAYTEPGFFTPAELENFYTPIEPSQSNWSFGWFANTDDSGARYLSISGATPGVQAGLIVDPQTNLVITAISNAWGQNSAGGDLVVAAPRSVRQKHLQNLDRRPNTSN